MSKISEKAKSIEPLFKNQQEAGRYLGHSGDWLRLNAKRHDLYKPSSGKSRQGAPALYHKDHLELIAEHMMNKELLTEDDAYRKWVERRMAALGEWSSPRKLRKRRKGKTS